MPFKAIRILHKGGAAELVTLGDRDLDEGDVTIAVEYSAMNYKDGLALLNRAPIVRRFPLTPGIDLAGRVVSSQSSQFAAGDQVVATGWGLGVTHDGGFAQMARVPAEWLVRLPEGMSTRWAAAIGTAGFTAMLAVLAIEHNGILPGSGDVLVTGASGGVGSMAIVLLSALGYRVLASTGKHEQAGYLRALGAAEVIGREELSQAAKPMGAPRWSGAIDSVGGDTLANVLACARPLAAIASVGLAQGAELRTTVYPFILRGVILAGINSVDASRELRVRAWSRLAELLGAEELERIISVSGLASALEMGGKILAGGVLGRVVIDVNA